MEKDKINNSDESSKEKDMEDVENLDNKENNKEDNSEKTKEITAEEKIKDLEDKLTRTFAEMENQRRRFEKEKEDAFEYGGFSFAKEALNLIDNLERSMASLENDEILKNTEALKKIINHIEIIHKDTISIFKKNNIEQIKSINEKLDPNLHQAMMEIEDDSKEAGTIVQEIQKGFTMKNRLLRRSLFGVSKKSEDIDEKNEENQQKSKEN